MPLGIYEQVRAARFLNNLIEIEFTCHTMYPFKLYNSMIFSIATEFCKHDHIHFVTFSSFPSPQRNSMPLAIILYYSLSLIPGNH